MQKTANVLDKLPKRVKLQAKSMIHQSWQADTWKSAEQVRTRFLASFGDSYPQAVENLASNRDQLVAIYDLRTPHTIGDRNPSSFGDR